MGGACQRFAKYLRSGVGQRDGVRSVGVAGDWKGHCPRLHGVAMVPDCASIEGTQSPAQEALQTCKRSQTPNVYTDFVSSDFTAAMAASALWEP